MDPQIRSKHIKHDHLLFPPLSSNLFLFTLTNRNKAFCLSVSTLIVIMDTLKMLSELEVIMLEVEFVL